MTFENVRFKGTFRSYQQKILNRAEPYMQDGRIHIVAAPGSGKTILGLELIRRLGKPCLILSPTTAIRQQWADRFEEMFLPQGQSVDSYFSFDLRRPALFTSITFQALHAAMRQLKLTDGEDTADFTDFELAKTLRSAGIGTVCMDEAHHLRSDWQNSLERFLSGMGSGLMRISLTATPPYDASAAEWAHYITTCGEIDDEIFVPELVCEGTLCPHQDYVYFSDPSPEEQALFRSYRSQAWEAAEKIAGMAGLSEVLDRLSQQRKERALPEEYYARAREYAALLAYARAGDVPVDEELIKLLGGERRLPRWSLAAAETALNLLLELLENGSAEWQKDRRELVSYLIRMGLYERRKVQLDLNDSLRRRLAASVGKLAGITEIADSEYRNLGRDLRMVILTDYIKREQLESEEVPSEISVASIFRALQGCGIGILPEGVTQSRETCGIGILTGSLILLPLTCRPQAALLANYRDVPFRVRESLRFPGYGYFDFGPSNSVKVDIVGRLFERGEFPILIGTKSLLGEGWDSPCINNLLLASFVGSFVMSNQMRGRAIRIDRRHPDKVANIWHLVAIDSQDDTLRAILNGSDAEWEMQTSPPASASDWSVLARRFKCFVGPNYSTGKIESGLRRLCIEAPPDGEEALRNQNADTLQRAANRSSVQYMWIQNATATAQLYWVTKVPRRSRVPVFTYEDRLRFGGEIVLGTVSIALLSQFWSTLFHSGSSLGGWLVSFVAFLSVWALGAQLFYIGRNGSAMQSIRGMSAAVLEALRERKLIGSSCILKSDANPAERRVDLALENASVREQNLFLAAMREFFSPVDNPRYVLVKKGLFRPNYAVSFAVPAVLSQNKASAECLRKHVEHRIGPVSLFYTRSSDGLQELMRCRRNSFLNTKKSLVEDGQHYRKWVA